MPRSCSICSHERTAEMSKAIARGDSNRQISSHFNVTASAVQRHRVNCLRAPRKQKAETGDDGTSAGSHETTGASGSIRFDSQDPASLVSTTARLVDEALDLLEHAKKGDDRKTALAALREARDGLQLLMRASGMLTSDNAVTVQIDARRQAMNVIGKLSEDELRALAYGAPIAPQSLPAGAHEAIDATEVPQSERVAS